MELLKIIAGVILFIDIYVAVGLTVANSLTDVDTNDIVYILALLFWPIAIYVYLVRLIFRATRNVLMHNKRR